MNTTQKGFFDATQALRSAAARAGIDVAKVDESLCSSMSRESSMKCLSIAERMRKLRERIHTPQEAANSSTEQPPPDMTMDQMKQVLYDIVRALSDIEGSQTIEEVLSAVGEVRATIEEIAR
jgi:hypothetical protein